MEDILIIDNNSIEESVIDETDYKDNQPIDRDFSLDKSINNDELVKEESLENESKQVNQSDGVILGSNVINNNNNLKSVINPSDISDGFDAALLWSNSHQGSALNNGTYNLQELYSDYDYILINWNWHISYPDSYSGSCILSRSQFESTERYPNSEVSLVAVNSSGTRYTRIFKKGQNNTFYTQSSTPEYNIIRNIYGLNVKTISGNDNPVVSGNNIYNYNYYIGCDGVSDNSLSYNVLNKPLNEYNVQESLIGMSVLFMLGFGFVILMRKAVFRWR